MRDVGLALVLAASLALAGGAAARPLDTTPHGEFARGADLTAVGIFLTSTGMAAEWLLYMGPMLRSAEQLPMAYGGAWMTTGFGLMALGGNEQQAGALQRLGIDVARGANAVGWVSWICAVSFEVSVFMLDVASAHPYPAAYALTGCAIAANLTSLIAVSIQAGINRAAYNRGVESAVDAEDGSRGARGQVLRPVVTVAPSAGGLALVGTF